VTAFECAQRKMGEHGPSVMPLYANVRNPYVATLAQKTKRGSTDPMEPDARQVQVMRRWESRG